MWDPVNIYIKIVIVICIEPVLDAADVHVAGVVVVLDVVVRIDLGLLQLGDEAGLRVPLVELVVQVLWD